MKKRIDNLYKYVAVLALVTAFTTLILTWRMFNILEIINQMLAI